MAEAGGVHGLPPLAVAVAGGAKKEPLIAAYSYR
jgi:hypothetical protein